MSTRVLSVVIGVGALAAGVVLLHCSPQDVLVGDVTGLNDASDGGEGGTSEPTYACDPTVAVCCTSNDDCEPSQFCARKTCGDKTGECHARPTFCDSMRMEVCGCDGVTYWNDCLRAFNGATAATPGECDVGRQAMCGGPSGKTCPDEAFCARLFPEPKDCGGPPPPPPPDGGMDASMVDASADASTLGGKCWYLPPTCPAGDPQKWTGCGPSGTHDCLDTCSAIATETPHFALMHMMMCPK